MHEEQGPLNFDGVNKKYKEMKPASNNTHKSPRKSPPPLGSFDPNTTGYWILSHIWGLTNIYHWRHKADLRDCWQDSINVQS